MPASSPAELRDRLIELHAQVMPHLPDRVLRAAQKKLGLHRMRLQGTLLDDAQLVVNEYALYHWRPESSTLIESELEGDEQDDLRDALPTYRVSVFETLGLGGEESLQMADLLYGRPIELSDADLRGQIGMDARLGCGVLDLGATHIAAGPVLPVSQEALGRTEQALHRTFGSSVLDRQSLDDTERASADAIVWKEVLRDQR